MAVTAVASSTTSAQALAANPSRNAVILCNSDANDAYILYGAGTASASNLSLILEPKANARLPKEYVDGELNVVWAADGSGSLHITTA